MSEFGNDFEQPILNHDGVGGGGAAMLLNQIMR